MHRVLASDEMMGDLIGSDCLDNRHLPVKLHINVAGSCHWLLECMNCVCVLYF